MNQGGPYGDPSHQARGAVVRGEKRYEGAANQVGKGGGWFIILWRELWDPGPRPG